MLTRRDRGDTLIEVIVAFGVFSLVTVGSLTIMNQGASLSQRSLELGLVRQAVNSQAETLRFMHDSYLTTYAPGQTFDPAATNKGPAWQWQNMTTNIVATGATSITAIGGAATTCPSPAPGSFIMDSQKGQFVTPAAMVYTPASTYAKVDYTNGPKPQGIWIEAIRSQTNGADPYQGHLGYIDFHILACWPGPGSDIPMTLTTIVRLYEPR